jgi:hypothetical protein
VSAVTAFASRAMRAARDSRMRSSALCQTDCDLRQVVFAGNRVERLESETTRHLAEARVLTCFGSGQPDAVVVVDCELRRRSGTPDDESSALLRRLVGNGLAHLRGRVRQRPRPTWPQLPDLRIGTGRTPRVELPGKLAQALVRRAQRAQLEHLTDLLVTDRLVTHQRTAAVRHLDTTR